MSQHSKKTHYVAIYSKEKPLCDACYTELAVRGEKTLECGVLKGIRVQVYECPNVSCPKYQREIDIPLEYILIDDKNTL